MKRRVSFCYVVQIDMPGNPIKVGCSARLRTRFSNFLHSTPADMQLVGATIDGAEREKALKAAIAPTLIRGEWGLPNEAVQSLLNEWFDAGEWFVPAESKRAVYEALNVSERVAPHSKYEPKVDANNYWWAKQVLQAVADTDPLLGLHWDGFLPATERPILAGIRAIDRIAA